MAKFNVNSIAGDNLTEATNPVDFQNEAQTMVDDSTTQVMDFDDMASLYENGLDNLKSNDVIKSEHQAQQTAHTEQVRQAAQKQHTAQEMADIAALNKSISDIGSENIAGGISLVTSFAAGLIVKSDKGVEEKYKIDSKSQKNISTAIKLLTPVDKPMMSPWALVLLSIIIPVGLILFQAWQDRKLKDENDALKHKEELQRIENERLQKENEELLLAEKAEKARIAAN